MEPWFHYRMRMNPAPLLLADYPRAILHVDADAFFTSVEQALNPGLRGKPVVTGQERGIIACASYEAKALGIQRGITLSDARRICPGLTILPSDYETYGLFSQRMFTLMRQYTPQVEEYSIDEAFADITGLRRLFRCSYEEIAQRLQAQIHAELGITVSVGLSPTKSLAKICSKFRKPVGFTGVPGPYIHLLLQRIPLEKVWGFGPNTVSLLQKFGLRTAYDFVRQPEPWAARLLHKPGRDAWHELRGHSVWPVDPEVKRAPASVSRSKTFTPPSASPALVYAQLLRNAESAFRQARRHKLRATVLGVILRRQDFRHDGLEARLSRATACRQEAMPTLRALFEQIFQPGVDYRSTLIVLGGLVREQPEQYELFEDRPRIESLRRLTEAVDALSRKYGTHTVVSAAELHLKDKPDTRRDAPPARLQNLLPGETPRRKLAIPRLDLKV